MDKTKPPQLVKKDLKAGIFTNTYRKQESDKNMQMFQLSKGERKLSKREMIMKKRFE